MPFPIIYGTPEGTAKQFLQVVRSLIINVVAKEMKVPAGTVRPFFPDDLAGAPSQGEDDTIYCRLDTGMFGRGTIVEAFAGIGRALGWKDPVHAKRQQVTKAVADVIWLAFDGKYEVEVFVGDLVSLGKTIIKPR